MGPSESSAEADLMVQDMAQGSLSRRRATAAAGSPEEKNTPICPVL